MQLWRSVVFQRRIHNSAQISEVNCAPLSDVIIAGTPKRGIQLKNSASVQSLVLVAERGIASNHLVDLSMIVNRCVKPLDDGRGPTISTCICEKRLEGTGICCISDLVCLCIFPFWQSAQLSHHSFTSLFSFFQTNLSEIILLVALIPGCEIVWRAEKTSLFIVSGTRGRGVPVETSHNNSTF